jgi:hypothetical protein
VAERAGETPMAIDQTRVAAAFSPEAVSRERVFTSAMCLCWCAATAFQFRRHGVGSTWFPLLFLILAMVRAVAAWRLHPRTPDDVTDEEVRQAMRLARACRRCESKVLLSESRCPRCGSRSHEFTFAARGIDVWMPLMFLCAVLALVALAAVLR